MSPEAREALRFLIDRRVRQGIQSGARLGRHQVDGVRGVATPGSWMPHGTVMRVQAKQLPGC